MPMCQGPGPILAEKGSERFNSKDMNSPMFNAAAPTPYCQQFPFLTEHLLVSFPENCLGRVR